MPLFFVVTTFALDSLLCSVTYFRELALKHASLYGAQVDPSSRFQIWRESTVRQARELAMDEPSPTP